MQSFLVYHCFNKTPCLTTYCLWNSVIALIVSITNSRSWLVICHAISARSQGRPVTGIQPQLFLRTTPIFYLTKNDLDQSNKFSCDVVISSKFNCNWTPVTGYRRDSHSITMRQFLQLLENATKFFVQMKFPKDFFNFENWYKLD